MKRRLAMLLALSLTFTMLPAGYASAAETETPEAVEMAVEEEVNDDAEAVEETNDAVVEAATNEGTTLVEDTTEGQTEEQVDVVPETETTEAEPADAVTEDGTEEAVTGSTDINAEIAEPEEPEVTEAVTDAKAMWHGFEYTSSGNVQHYWESGKIVKNRLVKDSSTGKKYYFDENGNPIKNAWQEWNSKYYYLGADGAALSLYRYLPSSPVHRVCYHRRAALQRRYHEKDL